MRTSTTLRLEARGALVLCVLSLVPATFGDPPTQPSAPSSEEHAAPSFTVGIEDVLRIVVWDEPDLSASVTVRPDGMITIPLINDVKVDGLTPEEIRQELTKRLGEFVRDPRVTVVVETINSYRVYFVGEVNTQGAIQLFRPMRVLQAVAMAGGPSEFSKGKITLVREEYGVERRIEIDYKKLLAGDAEQENIFLRPGDLLIFK